MKLKFKTGDDEVARIMELAYIKRKRAEKNEAEKKSPFLAILWGGLFWAKYPLFWLP